MRAFYSQRFSTLLQNKAREREKSTANVTVRDGTICIQTSTNKISRVHLYDPDGEPIFIRETNASCIFMPVNRPGQYLLAFTIGTFLETREIEITLSDIIRHSREKSAEQIVDSRT